MMLFDHISGAYRSLGRNRGRSFLTTLGIAIGVASVVAIMALTAGVTKIIDHQVNELDGNLIVVRPGLVTGDPDSLTSPFAQSGFSTSTLSENDVQRISEIKGIEAAAPIMTIDGRLTGDTDTVTNNVVVATTPNFANITKLPIQAGQFIDDVTDKDTAVLGSQLAVDLFGTDRPIGHTFTLHSQRFTVIGVLKPMNNPVNYNSIDFDHAAIVSMTAGKTFNQGHSQIQQINVRVKDTQAISKLSEAISKALTTSHLGEKDFTISSGMNVAPPTSRIFTGLSAVLVAIAGISLFVGGIGVMNIMLVGVAERTREIGIRKAVGASNASITWQFLMESLLISLIGGVAGYFLGYLVAFVISTFLFFSPAFTIYSVIAALVMSVGCGVLFGIYPALRAARKDTIESLRQYH